MAKSAQQMYHTHITSKHNWYDLKLKEVWAYRDLIVLFTKRDFSLIYKQTILGPAWVFMTPLISSIIYAVVFGGIAGIGTGGVPGFLFYLCSNAIWILFSTCVTRNATTFTGNANVFGKVYFPRLTIPISNMLSAVIQFLVQMTMVMGMLVYYVIQGAVHPQWQLWPLIPIILMHIGLLGLGFGIIISSLTTKYRDLSILVGFGVQLWMYATPIVYPMSQLEEGTLKSLIMINPVSAPVETLRCIILGEGQIMPEYLFLSVLMTVAIVMMGIAIFNKVEKTFMDTV